MAKDTSKLKSHYLKWRSIIAQIDKVKITEWKTKMGTIGGQKNRAIPFVVR